MAESPLDGGVEAVMQPLHYVAGVVEVAKTRERDWSILGAD